MFTFITDSFGRKQNLAVIKLFLSLITSIDFAGPCTFLLGPWSFFQPYHFWFFKEILRGAVRVMLIKLITWHVFSALDIHLEDEVYRLYTRCKESH